jgi:NADPH2:quinone reductase
MQYVAMSGGGGPDVLHLARGPVPEPRAGDVLIRVMAAGINRPDIQQRKGLYPPPPDASPVLGLEVAGEVVALGQEVSGWRPGDRVCALANGGGYAEFCAAPAGQCLPWPAGYDAIRAAALPETYFTVWANLFGLGRLRPGEIALVHGGTGGIGLTAIQLAREFGARVFATAGSAAKCEACRRFGAEQAINYRQEDFLEAVRRFTDKRGVDVVLDIVGAPYTPRNLRALAKDGRLVQIAFMHGSKADGLDLMPIMVKRLTVTGSTMRPRTAAEKGAIADELRGKVWPALDQGRCGPVVHAVFPLAEVAQAHALMETSEHVGKIMLKVAE